MFVSLLQDVRGLGKKNERVRVSDAYARNVLIPKKLATIGEQSEHRLTPKKPTVQSIDHSQAIKKLEAPFEFILEANEKGGLYEKIDEKNISAKVAQRLQISQNMVQLKDFETIKSIGEFIHIVGIDKQSFQIRIIVKAR